MARYVIAAMLVGCGSHAHRAQDASADPDAAGDAPDAPPRQCGVIGDLSQPAEIQLFHPGIPPLAPVAAMDRVPLFIPTQGGYVFDVEVHARNVDGCNLSLTTVLRDPCTNQVATFETRPSVMHANPDGWGVPNGQSDEAEVPSCPHVGYAHNVDGEPFQLEITASDTSGHQAKASVTIVPSCAEGTCVCLCSADYSLGTNCATYPDAGVPTSCP
jgi:hypothetical protein